MVGGVAAYIATIRGKLLGVPKTIEEDTIIQTLDKELKLVEQKLLLENNQYKLSKSQRSKWLNYALVREFPAGMPWEGAEEKKQKQTPITPVLCTCSMCTNQIMRG